jgi:hypothetical protein
MRYGKYGYNIGNANCEWERRLSVFARTYLDLNASHQFLERWRAELLVQNAFNRYRDKNVLGNRSNGINPYSFVAMNVALCAALNACVAERDAR